MCFLKQLVSIVVFVATVSGLSTHNEKETMIQATCATNHCSVEMDLCMENDEFCEVDYDYIIGMTSTYGQRSVNVMNKLLDHYCTFKTSSRGECSQYIKDFAVCYYQSCGSQLTQCVEKYCQTELTACTKDSKCGDLLGQCYEIDDNCRTNSENFNTESCNNHVNKYLENSGINTIQDGLEYINQYCVSWPYCDNVIEKLSTCANKVHKSNTCGDGVTVFEDNNVAVDNVSNNFIKFWSKFGNNYLTYLSMIGFIVILGGAVYFGVEAYKEHKQIKYTLLDG